LVFNPPAESGKVKNLPFFKFDAESWLSGRIQYIPVEEIGIYINLVARIWKAGGELRNDRFLPRILGASREQFDAAMQDFLELEIITETDGMLRIKFLDEQLNERAAFISKCAEGGRKGKKRTPETPASDPQGTSNPPTDTPEQPASNKKEERREQKEESREEINNAPAPAADAEAVLGPELAGAFKRWLYVWRESHGNGRDMPVFQQEAQLRILCSLPEKIRKDAIERAIRGSWKAIHDIRQPRQAERSTAATTRQTGTLTEEPQYSNNERGKR
jgi:uncharacterized protein YdaU (DUF1376 family)